MSIEKLDFQKITREELPYTIFLNSVIQFINNAEALAIYVYLYSLPSNWSINKEHLASKFNLGDKKLRSIFSYLRRANLLEYRQPKNKKTGKMQGTTVHLLNGEKFDQTVLFNEEKTGEAKIALAEKTEAAISDRAVNRPCGDEGLQKKQDTKQKALTKETKKLLSKKSVDNSKRHSFAKSMDQMAREQKNIEQHTQRKVFEMTKGIPQEIKDKLGMK